MTTHTLAGICGGISFTSLFYMYTVTQEGTNTGWVIFFVFLAFAILFNNLTEQERRIQELGLPKKELTDEERRFAKFMEKQKQDEIETSRDIFALSPQSKNKLYKEMGLTKDGAKGHSKK